MSDAVDRLQQLASGALTPAEAMAEAVDRAERLDPTLNAIVEPDYERASDRAGTTEAGSGPLAGLPIAIKDYLPIAGGAVFMGNRVLKELDVRPEHTAAVARRLADAGAISLGTTHAPEFASGNCPGSSETALYGSARNPWDTDRTPMGSSGGSAAAVAAGIVAMAHGSDGGGSIRIPAAACGLVGLKPSRHRISAAPGAALWSGLVSDGVLTRTVRDSALGLDVLAGPETGDAERPIHSTDSHLGAIEVPPDPLRIGFATDFGFTDSAPDGATAVRAAAGVLESLGHRVEAAHPAALDTQDPLWPFGVVVAGNTSAMLAGYERRIGRAWQEDDLESGTWENLQKGRRRSAAEFVQARTELIEWSRAVSSWWTPDGDGGGFDILVTPVLGTDPPPVGTLVAGGVKERAAALRPVTPFTWQFNITGHPAISLPLGWTAAGLPVGVQLVADHGRDDLLLRLSAQLEAEYRWAERTPTIWAGTEGGA